MTPRIRPFTLDDRTGLVRAIDSVCGEGRWMRTTRFQPDEGWEHALESPDCGCHLLLVVEDGGLVAGWCRTFPTSEDKQGAALGIGLLAPYRDGGLGTAMVHQSLDWARRTGYQRVCLTTFPDNERAIHVFKRCGFEFTGVVDGDLLEMARILGTLGVSDEGGQS